MAGDQNTPNTKRAIWVNFFGMETACLPGIEFYAKLFDLPVIFMEIRREKRGYYRCYVSMIAENPPQCAPGEITQRYMSKLEEVMRKIEGSFEGLMLNAYQKAMSWILEEDF